MVCYISCAFAVAFLVASLYIMLTNNFKQYEDTFTNAIGKEVYEKIVKERLKIYLIASGIGLVVGLIYIFWMKNKMNRISLVCTAVLIFFLLQTIIYLVYPKSDYILKHIQNSSQATAWIEMYSQMMKKFWIGFFLGLIGYTLLAWALTK